MKVLVTGGLGFIGSHICVELLDENHDIVIIDNLNNSDISTVDKIKKISNKNFNYYIEDLLNFDKIKEIFEKEKIDSIIHCAGHKAVGESINKPLKYYQENLNMTFNLLKLVKIFNIKSFVFSSSATVYGSYDKVFSENDTIGLNITNPYGQTKYMQEVIIKDFSKNLKKTNFIILRYFNPVGAHKSGLIGENPNDIPNNLMPYIMRVASNNNCNKFKESCYDKLTIFGNDYNTKDGTCIRDFIHVVDLASSHVKAINYNKKQFDIFNIGTGNGCSVLELVESFKKINNLNLNYLFGKRREGDISVVVCNPSKANNELNWKAKYNINDMVKDSWNFIKNN